MCCIVCFGGYVYMAFLVQKYNSTISPWLFPPTDPHHCPQEILVVLVTTRPTHSLQTIHLKKKQKKGLEYHNLRWKCIFYFYHEVLVTSKYNSNLVRINDGFIPNTVNEKIYSCLNFILLSNEYFISIHLLRKNWRDRDREIQQIPTHYVALGWWSGRLFLCVRIKGMYT